MRGRTWERWGAISGLAALAVAGAAVTFERATPDPDQSPALPSWLGWLSTMVAAVHLVAWFGITAGTGPLTPGGWVTFAVYPVFVVWLVAVITVMITHTSVAAKTSS